MAFGTILCYAMLATVLYFFNPYTAGLLGIGFFYVSAALSCTGTMSILGLLARVLFTKNTVMYKMVVDSFRQAILFSALVVVSLFMVRHHSFTALNALLLVFMLVLLETYFISHKKSKVA